MKREEIWWAEVPPPVGSRPVVILTRDAVLDNIGAIVVALITRTARQLPTEVALGRRQGLPVRCVANLDNILTVPRHRSPPVFGSVVPSRRLRSVIFQSPDFETNSPPVGFKPVCAIGL